MTMHEKRIIDDTSLSWVNVLNKIPDLKPARTRFEPGSHGRRFIQRTLTDSVRGSITVQLTSSLNGLDSVALLMVNLQQIYLFDQIQTSQTGGQPYSYASPYKVSECYLWPIL